MIKIRLLYLFLLLVSFQLTIAQQVPREEVLLEGFTGTW